MLRYNLFYKDLLYYLTSLFTATLPPFYLSNFPSSLQVKFISHH